jgi:hypothetical protein
MRRVFGMIFLPPATGVAVADVDEDHVEAGGRSP